MRRDCRLKQAGGLFQIFALPEVTHLARAGIPEVGEGDRYGRGGSGLQVARVEDRQVLIVGSGTSAAQA